MEFSTTFFRRFSRSLAVLLLVLTCWAQAELLVNWECGFEVQIPDTWLRRDLKEQGLKLSSDDVRIDIEPYVGITYANQIQRLHKLTKEEQHMEFKSERDLQIHGVDCHEMIFYRNERYKIYYVFAAGQGGFLWTILSDSTDSPAFMESQGILDSFVITPKQG